MVNSDKKKGNSASTWLDIIKSAVPYAVGLTVILGVVLLIPYLPKFVTDAVEFVMCYVGFFAWIYAFKAIGEEIDEKLSNTENHETKSIILTLLIMASMSVLAVKLWK